MSSTIFPTYSIVFSLETLTGRIARNFALFLREWFSRFIKDARVDFWCHCFRYYAPDCTIMKRLGDSWTVILNEQVV